MSNRLLLGIAAFVVLAVGGFVYVWWTQGDLQYYAARVSAGFPTVDETSPPGDVPPGGLYIAINNNEISITEENGTGSRSYPLAATVQTFRGLTETEPMQAADLRPGATILLMLNEEGAVAAIHLLNTI